MRVKNALVLVLNDWIEVSTAKGRAPEGDVLTGRKQVIAGMAAAPTKMNRFTLNSDSVMPIESSKIVGDEGKQYSYVGYLACLKISKLKEKFWQK